MPRSDRLALIVFSGGYDRVHYALALAAAAAASGRLVTLLFSGRALRALSQDALCDTQGWHALDPADDGSPPVDRDRAFGVGGIATFEELLAACAALDVRIIACEMGLRALGLPAPPPLRADLPITIGGIVGFLNAAADGAMLFI